jgi:hypothetical protein
LQARCAVIAAANPIKGRYNPIHSFQENVELTEPILSRFDILCVVKDAVDVETDTKLAQFVVSSHIRSHPDAVALEGDETLKMDEDIIDQNLLRKYLMYSRENIHPRLNELDQDKLAKVYAALRKESIVRSPSSMYMMSGMRLDSNDGSSRRIHDSYGGGQCQDAFARLCASRRFGHGDSSHVGEFFDGQQAFRHEIVTQGSYL